MKSIVLILCVLAMPFTSLAKKGGPETEALYIVPSPPELIDHSRFIVQIVDAFKGPETEKISYIFPEVLIGEKDRLIELTRIEGTENSWQSDLVTAHCTIYGDTFSCNIHINRPTETSWLQKVGEWLLPKAHAAILNLCQGHAVANLSNMGLSPTDVTQFTKVIGHFCSNEPAGFMSYEFQ